MQTALFSLFFITLITLLNVNAVAQDKAFVEARRLNLWSKQLHNPDLVHSTYKRINHLRGKDPASWVYEWSQLADYFKAKAVAFETAGELAKARYAYLHAAKIYGIARFPAKTLPGQLAAYHKQLENYQLAGRYFNPPLQVLQIPYDKGHIVGYLHLPEDGGKPPLILWNGGIDTWKSDAFNSIQPFLTAGFAVLTFDVLGTGESSNWVARYDATDLQQTVLEFMQKSPLVDGRYIAQIGFSFSGYYAARLSIIEPRLFAVVAACAGVDKAWSNMVDGAPWEIKEALAAALHLKPTDEAGIKAAVGQFSLVKQGLLAGPDSVKVPLLVVDGDQDNLVPVSDLHLLADAGRETDLWIMGGDAHCFGQYRSIVMPKMAGWLEGKLQKAKSK